MPKLRVVLAKVGLDGHDVGILLVAKQLIAAGFETIYLGKRNEPAGVAMAALQEDAGVVGVSALSGGLAVFAIDTVNLLADLGIAHVPVIAGGIDEPAEVRRMLDAGVRAYFGPGTAITDIVEAFRSVGLSDGTDRASRELRSRHSATREVEP
jgi:methylmalonyl-CoA mutase cobalamin-binding domain/chain